MQRVYHPTLVSWYDVPESTVDDWKKNGWTTDRPKHFSKDGDDQSIEVGEGYVVPTTIGPDVPDEQSSEATPPNGNASTDEWRGYALSQGASEEDVEGLSRDDLRSIYGTPAE